MFLSRDGGRKVVTCGAGVRVSPYTRALRGSETMKAGARGEIQRLKQRDCMYLSGITELDLQSIGSSPDPKVLYFFLAVMY